MAAGTQDDLAELKCLVLESMREILGKNVDPTKFLPFLRSKFVLDGRESDTIKSCCSKSVQDGADKLIDVLCTKGAKGYDVFCDAILYDKTQVFLLTALNKRLEIVKHVKKEQEAARAQQMLEQQRYIHEQTQVRPYNPAMGGGTSAHTTTCLNYVQPHTTRPQHYVEQVRMPSRSPGDQQYPLLTTPAFPHQQVTGSGYVYYPNPLDPGELGPGPQNGMEQFDNNHPSGQPDGQ